MFKIVDFCLINYDKQIVRTIPLDKSINYIYAPNSKGKTLLIDCIDYILGSSTISFENNIDFIGIKYISCNCSNCSLIRDITDNRRCFIKKETNESGKIQIVTFDQYKTFILNSILEGKSSDLSILNRIYGEDLTYRPFLIFNFLNQKNHGATRFIFTKLFETQYYILSKPIFKYLFNKNNIQEIYNNTIKIDELKKERDTIKLDNNVFDFYSNKLREELMLLNIPYTNDYLELEKQLFSKKKEFSFDKKEKNVVNKDYYSLLDLNTSLSSQIIRMEQEETQSSIAIKDSEKRKRILLALDNIIKNDVQLEYLVLPLRELINKNELYSNFVKVQDYKKTIEELKKKKIQVATELKQYVANKKENDYLDVSKAIDTAIDLIDKLKDMKVGDIKNIEKNIKELGNKNRLLENEFDSNLESEISLTATSIYKTLLNLNIDFVKQDFLKNDFQLMFDYRQMSVHGSFVENGTRINYDIGSHARQTIIQICCYLSFLSFLSKHNYSLPILKTVMFDCVSQPCDKKTKPCIDSLLNYYINHIDSSYNFVVTSDDHDSCGTGLFDMSSGLNPYLTK